MKFTKLICAALAITSFSAVADDDALTVLALKRASFSLEQAVEKVTNDYQGQIIEFEVDDHDGQSSYEIEVINLQKEEKYKLQLSMADGAVLEEKSRSLSTLGFSRLDDDEYLALKELETSQFSLPAAIAQLREQYKAELVEFELENEKGITFYKFKLMDQQGRKRVIVDVETGEMIPIMKH